MTVTDENLTAYADGELPPDKIERVAAAIAGDPALSARLNAEARLRAALGQYLNPVLDETVPDSLVMPIAGAAAREAEERMTDPETATSYPHAARGLGFGAARTRRQEAANRKKAVNTSKRALPGWFKAAVAMAACLILGISVGVKLPQGSAHMEADGRLIATGALADGLENRLASAEANGGVKIISSFQRPDSQYCRVYAAHVSAGIACKEGDNWLIERTMAAGTIQRAQYRQAGSYEGELMAAAQEMASGDALNLEQEQAGRKNGWQRRR